MNSRRILTISTRIFKQIKRDKRTLGLMIAAPILVTLLFSWAFAGKLTGIPVIAYNIDQPLEKRVADAIIQVLENNDMINITLNDPNALNKLGNVYQAVIIFKENLTRSIILTGEAEIQIYLKTLTQIDAQILTQIITNNISKAIKDFLGTKGITLKINKTVQINVPYPTPFTQQYNVCILDYDEKLDIILGNLVINELMSNKDVSLHIVNSREKCISMIKDNKAVLGIIIPNNFTKQILLHNSSTIELYINGIQQDEMTTALKAFEEAVNDALEKVFGEKTVEISKNYIYGSEEFSSIDFLAPSFLGFIAMFFTFIISGILFLRERLIGTLERMLASATTHTEIVLGYLISFLIVATIQSTIITLVTLIFSTKILENFLQIYTLVLLLAMGSVSLSIFLSSYMKTELQVVQMIPIYIVPQIFLSGLIFSLKALPEFLRPLAYILPLTYYVDAVKKIIYMNATLTNILPQLTILTAYFILGIILGIKKFRKEIT